MNKAEPKQNETERDQRIKNGMKALETKAPKSKLYFPPFEIHSALKAYVKEAYGLEIDVEDFGKNNGMIELSGEMVKK